MFEKSERIKIIGVEPISMVDRDGLQRVNFQYACMRDRRFELRIYDGRRLKIRQQLSLLSGENAVGLMLPKIERDFTAKLVLADENGEICAEKTFEWKKPLEREIYIVVSSHTDIGLHNSQYIQRYNSEKFLDEAMKLINETDGEADYDRYRYTIEGTWFWNNYPDDRGADAAENIAENYIQKGKIGICGGVAGNHTHVYGAEELCRSVYPRKELEETWGIKTETISMIDNNGFHWSIVQPYVEAGIRNIFFSPNQWNPIPSTVWHCNKEIPGYTWNSEAGGGGARIDVRYGSALPMLFWWESCDTEQRLLVWSSLQYDNGSKIFGFNHRYDCSEETLGRMEKNFAKRLPSLDKKYPYRVWLMADYGDDQFPDLKLQNTVKEWNRRWAFPRLRISGDIDEPFEIIRKEYAEMVPTLRGDITGGWYQHPLAAADLTSRKLNADRRLAAAEKACVITALNEEHFCYPKERLDRAWYELLMNDEHSYGASGYVGRRVFETWLQHRVWVENAEKTADELLALSFKAQCDDDDEYITFFNPSANDREALVRYDGKLYKTGKLPPLKFKSVKRAECRVKEVDCGETHSVPVVENEFYKVVFAENGSIRSIYDKELNSELLDKSARCGVNEFLYTKDNHATFSSPKSAKFSVSENTFYVQITALSQEENSGASLETTVKIYKKEKKIEFDDKIYHIRDMFNNDRWKRYVYIAFPVRVENAKRIVYHNGVKSEYAKDVTGHGTDVYAACNEWCAVQTGDFGVGLVMRDSQIVEFDHIHPDKTDFGRAGDGSAIYAYVANDWLQRHVSGGSYINFQFRFLLTSYNGDHQSAKFDEKAENFVNDIETQSGKLKNGLKQNSDIRVRGGRLVGLKVAETGTGVIARTCGDLRSEVFLNGKRGVRVATDERVIADENLVSKGHGLATWLFEGYRIKRKKDTTVKEEPLKIGGVYTGLIDAPKATCGENRGHLYLLWGRNRESDLDHYELYRGEEENFEPNENTFISDVKPEEYCVARYQDCGLADDRVYYYILRAVNTAGKKGEFSAVFSGRTRELIDGKEQKLSDLSGAATSESRE